MKNLIVSVSGSLLAFLILGFLSDKNIPNNSLDLKPSQTYKKVFISSNKLLDSIEHFKASKHQKYEFEIKKSLENVKNQEKKQEELNLSIDSIYCVVDSSNIINN